MTNTFARLCVCGLIASLGATAGQAQTRRQVKQPPAELIAGFVHDHGVQGRHPSQASVDLMSVLLGQADYPSGSLATVLDGLEEVALSEVSPDVRAEAALTLSMAGSRSARKPEPATLARLERIYARSDDPQVKAAVVSGVARAAEHRSTLVFLEKVATRDPADYPGASVDALAAMASHADSGSAVLRRLHTTGVVHDPEGSQWLDLVASRGYRIQ